MPPAVLFDYAGPPPYCNCKRSHRCARVIMKLSSPLRLPASQKAAIVSGVIRDVLPRYASGAIRVAVDSIVPLHEAQRAHELLESTQTIGKVILGNRGTFSVA